MIATSIFKIDLHKIDCAVGTYIERYREREGPNFIVMSRDTLSMLSAEFPISLMSLVKAEKRYESKYKGIPIALNDTLRPGEINIV